MREGAGVLCLLTREMPPRGKVLLEWRDNRVWAPPTPLWSCLHLGWFRGTWRRRRGWLSGAPALLLCGSVDLS